MKTPRDILVTGGCGFVGSAFIRYLFGLGDFSGRVLNLDLLTQAGSRENLAGAVDDTRYTFVHGDICDQDLVSRLCEKHQVDTIVNFAAESNVDRSIDCPNEFVRTNAMGTFYLLEVARGRPAVHFHQVSTDEVYGELGETGCFDENSHYRPASPYAASKAAADHLVRSYARSYGLSTTISVSSNNYGPFQTPEKYIPLMILNARDRRALPVYGDGLNIRDWVYVDDHVEALWSILCRGRGAQTYNIGGESDRTNLAVANRIVEVVAEIRGDDPEALRGLITFVKDRPGHNRRCVIDCGKLENELGWRPRRDFETNLRDTIRWYIEHDDWVARASAGEYREWIEKNYTNR